MTLLINQIIGGEVTGGRGDMTLQDLKRSGRLVGCPKCAEKDKRIRELEYVSGNFLRTLKSESYLLGNHLFTKVRWTRKVAKACWEIQKIINWNW